MHSILSKKTSNLNPHFVCHIFAYCSGQCYVGLSMLLHLYQILYLNLGVQSHVSQVMFKIQNFRINFLIVHNVCLVVVNRHQ